MSKLKEHFLLVLILILFLCTFFLYLDYNADLWWDSSVYLGIGKYIYSSGSEGLYEASRPIIWPLILGFFWKLGLDAIFFGKLLVLVFGLGIIILTYIIAYEFFDKKIALLSALFLAFSPTFFLFSSILFTEIPSTFFIILGLYLFIKKDHALSGLSLGIALMTRFFQIITVIPIYLFFIYLIYKKKSTIKQFIISTLFLLIPLAPYLIVNAVLFDNPFYPFLLQSYMTKYTGWIFHQPFSFYFVNLIKENVLILFSVLGIFFIFKKEKLVKNILPFVFLLTFTLYNLAPHKEMRLLLPIFPLLYILTVYGAVKFTDLFKKYKNIILLFILILGVFSISGKLNLNTYDDKLDPFYDFMQDWTIEDGLWISNPSFIVYTDAKADELIYYPLYNMEKMEKLQNKIDKAKIVLINTCDVLPCPPAENGCINEHTKFINLLKKNFNLYSYELIDECEYYIFTSS